MLWKDCLEDRLGLFQIKKKKKIPELMNTLLYSLPWSASQPRGMSPHLNKWPGPSGTLCAPFPKGATCSACGGGSSRPSRGWVAYSLTSHCLFSSVWWSLPNLPYTSINIWWSNKPAVLCYRPPWCWGTTRISIRIDYEFKNMAISRFPSPGHLWYSSF